MPVIRRRYNYGNVLLNPGIVSRGFCLAGQTVDVLLRSRELHPVHFAGFVEVHDFHTVTGPVKVVNISGYTPDDDELFGQWTAYCSNTILLGCNTQDSVQLCINVNTKMPMAWCALPEVKR